MSNRWVISWLVMDYWRWSMSNRWAIEAQKFCGLSITHRWHRLHIDVIDYSSMTHRLLIDNYTAHERHLSCLLVPFSFFRWWFLYLCQTHFSVHFSLYLKFRLTMSRRKSANHKLYRWFSIVQYFTLPNWTVTNQYGNETNKYADKNRLRGYRPSLWAK